MHPGSSHGKCLFALDVLSIIQSHTSALDKYSISATNLDNVKTINNLFAFLIHDTYTDTRSISLRLLKVMVTDTDDLSFLDVNILYKMSEELILQPRSSVNECGTSLLLFSKHVQSMKHQTIDYDSRLCKNLSQSFMMHSFELQQI